MFGRIHPLRQYKRVGLVFFIRRTKMAVLDPDAVIVILKIIKHTTEGAGHFTVGQITGGQRQRTMAQIIVTRIIKGAAGILGITHRVYRVGEKIIVDSHLRRIIDLDSKRGSIAGFDEPAL
jgi:hypothetical protein